MHSPPPKPATWLAVAALVALAAMTAPARLTAAPMPGKLALYAGDATRGKIASDLLRARAMLAAQSSPAAVAAALPALRLSAQGVQLDVRLRSLTPALVERIRALGFTIDRAHYAAARLALTGQPEQLDALAAVPEVTAIHPRYAPRLRAGAVSDQADVSVHAAPARAAFDVDGSGQRVGVLSDSFNDRIGGQISGSGCERTLTGSTAQLSGDLPASVVVLDSSAGSGNDEGAAMAELVHDLAPGADILFRSAAVDEADFADAIDALRACGASVLVDDLIYLTEPMFQDGLVAAAAQRASDAGVPYFSAAGNEAGFGVLQTFVDPDPASEEADTPTGIDFNDFGGGNRFAAISLPAGCGVAVVLQWSEPFSGTLGPGAATDLDLYLYDQASASSQILASSIDSQGCSSMGGGSAGDPIEIASFVNSAPQARTVYVAVDNFCGAPAPTFRLVTFPDGNCGFPGTYGFDAVFHSPQIFGHPAAAGVVAVGAVDYRELDTNGAAHGSANTIDPEPFTSLGGDLPVFFDAAGTAVPGGVEYRFKPELAAPDGTNTSFFGGDRADDADTFPNFFGTSAAAPHSAAVAALVRQANPALAPVEIRTILMAGARDIGAPGIDPLAGAGSVDAMAAVAAARVQTSSTPTAVPSATPAAPTPTATQPQPTRTSARAQPTPTAAIPGDCDGDGVVSVADLIRGVDIALDLTTLSGCPSLDSNGDGHISIDELIRATSAVLGA